MTWRLLSFVVFSNQFDFLSCDAVGLELWLVKLISLLYVP